MLKLYLINDCIMQKITIIIGAVLLFGATSCVKERTCTCNYSYGGSNTYTEDYYLGRMTKEQALTRCSRYETALKNSGYEANCSI